MAETVDQSEIKQHYSTADVLLAAVYDQCGNHRRPERRHALTSELRDSIRDYLYCAHRWKQSFGPCLKCENCGATTILSFGGESKPILPPAQEPQE